MEQNDLLTMLLPDRRKVNTDTLRSMWAGALMYAICVIGGFSGYCRYLYQLPIPEDVELDVPDSILIELNDDASIEFAIGEKTDITVTVTFNGAGSLSSTIAADDPLHKNYHRDTLVGYVTIPLLDSVRTMYSTSPWLHHVVNTRLRRHLELLKELEAAESLPDEEFFQRSKEISDEIYTMSAAITKSIGEGWPTSI